MKVKEIGIKISVDILVLTDNTKTKDDIIEDLKNIGLEFVAFGINSNHLMKLDLREGKKKEI